MLDHEAFGKLFALRNNHAFQALRLNDLVWPAGWNAWAVCHYQTPNFSSFIDLQRFGQLPKGSISHRMARAIKEASVLELAICLAYCHAWQDCRAEVGDTLYAEAVKLYEQQRWLFVWETEQRAEMYSE